MKKQNIIVCIVFGVIVAALVAGICLTDSLYTRTEDISDVMQDAVLHERDRISLFGMLVNPGLISAFLVTAAVLLFAAAVRIFAIPKFKTVPGRFQLLLETLVGYFGGQAKRNSPHRNSFLGAYLFAAGVYIFVGTVLELFGLQAQNASGHSVSLPAPLSDINGAIALGCLSYLIILSGGIAGNGVRGIGRTLKDFSLPISMSFRLFGALLSGALDAEFSCVAASGNGIWHDYGGNTVNLIPEMYPCTDRMLDGHYGRQPERWDMAADPVDLVFIKLGANDWQYCSGVYLPEAERTPETLAALRIQFADKLYAFLDEVFTLRGDVPVLYIYEEDMPLKPEITAALARYAADHPACRLHGVGVHPKYPHEGVGAYGHWSAATHARVARELRERVRELLC